MPSTNSKQVYNLEFPVNIDQLKIGGYVFKRIDDYERAFQEMQHLGHTSGSEFSIRPNTGSHQITAYVTPPATEPAPALAWEGEHTQLSDVTLLLSIFTGRHVFHVDSPLGENEILISDHRKYKYGGVLECSPNFEEVEEITGDEWWQREHHDIGFERTINETLQLIRSREWQERYKGGHFLFLYQSAMEKRYAAEVFTQCWTIWSHIFGIENIGNYTEAQIRRSAESDRIKYVLEEYFYDPLDRAANAKIEIMAKARHRIVHFGKKSDDVSYDDLELFIRATEALIAKIFGLQPSNLYNTSERLSRYFGQLVPATNFQS